MKNNYFLKNVFLLLIVLLCGYFLQCSEGTSTTEKATTEVIADEEIIPSKIDWMEWSEGEKQASAKDKKVLVFVYDPGCETCKEMEKNTLNHPYIADYIVEHYYPIKLSIQHPQDIETKGKVYRFSRDLNGKTYHELAKALTRSTDELETPALIFLDEEMNLIEPAKGHVSPEKLEVLLEYVATDMYQQKPLNDFVKTYEYKTK